MSWVKGNFLFHLIFFCTHIARSAFFAPGLCLEFPFAKYWLNWHFKGSHYYQLFYLLQLFYNFINFANTDHYIFRKKTFGRRWHWNIFMEHKTSCYTNFGVDKHFNMTNKYYMVGTNVTVFTCANVGWIQALEKRIETIRVLCWLKLIKKI